MSEDGDLLGSAWVGRASRMRFSQGEDDDVNLKGFCHGVPGLQVTSCCVRVDALRRVFIITDKVKLVGEEVKGVGVMKDEEMKLEEIEASHTLCVHTRWKFDFIMNRLG